MKSPLSQKQIDSYNFSNKRINVWEGAVRSGKTFASILKFIKELRDGPPGNAMIVGVSRDAIQRNIIIELTGMLGMSCPTPKATQMNIFNRTIFIVGANDERAQRRIQGSTLALAYVDEITLLPQGFVKMLLSRLSVPGARLLATCNPDSPFHWIKTDFLDNPNLDMTQWQFVLDDNPSLSEDYKNNLKREYQGLWYKRYIEGLWVLAEGCVYDFFDESNHVIDLPNGIAEYYIVGVDYGISNPTVFTMLGVNKKIYPNVWLEKEYYYDSRKSQRQKTDTDYVEDLQSFIDGRNVTHIYVDPSATSLKVEMQRHGFDCVNNADNDVINGIRLVSSMLMNGTFKLCSNCKDTIREFQTYRWDEKAALKGEDKPLKDHDHCFIAGTKVKTKESYKNIEDIQKGEEVLTRSGFNKVLDIFEHENEVFNFNLMGKNITCTENHKFLTVNGWKGISNLLQSDMLFIEVESFPWLKSSFFRESNTDVIQNLKILVTEHISEHTNKIHWKDIDISIGTFGNSIMERFHKDTIFITKTAIRSTMTLAISNVYQLVNICPFMEKILLRIKNLNEDSIVKELENQHLNGMEVKKEENGIDNTEKKLGNQSKELQSAKSAKENISLQNDQEQNFVQISVKHRGDELIVLMMSLENVLDVIKNFPVIDTQKLNSVQSPVQRKLIGKRKVYNLHVENEHEFFAENILVSNCMDALRYALYTHFINDHQEFTKQQLDDLYNKSRGIQQDLPIFFQEISNSQYHL